MEETTMGFFDKVKEKAQQIKEENKNFMATTARINNLSTLYGRVNAPDSIIVKMDPNDDFAKGSYISIENGKGVIYSASRDDYFFTGSDIKSMTFTGETPDISIGSDRHKGLRFMIEFNDGKSAKVDIISTKVDLFKATFGL
jgi:hypothetical protein